MDEWIVLIFNVFFFLTACRILDPPPGIKPTPPALEVLTPGPPGKSLSCPIFFCSHSHSVLQRKTEKLEGDGGSMSGRWTEAGDVLPNLQLTPAELAGFHLSVTLRRSTPQPASHLESLGHQGILEQREAQGLRSHRLDLHLELASVIWVKICHLHSLKKPHGAHGMGVASTDPGAQLPDLASWLCHCCCASY